MTGVEIATIVISSVTAIRVFLGPIIARSWKKTDIKQEKALENHFLELKEGLIDNLRNVLQSCSAEKGSIVHTYQVNRINHDYLYSDVYRRDRLYDSFKKHFPTLAANFEEFRGELDINSISSKKYLEELEFAITEKTGLPMLTRQEGIHGNTVGELYLTLVQLEKGARVYHDFSKATIQREGSLWKLRREGYEAHMYASTSSEEKIKRCREGLIDITKDGDLRGKALKLDEDNQLLINKSNQIGKDLKDICDKYTKFGNTLKKTEGCDICNVIPEMPVKRFLKNNLCWRRRQR